MGDPLSIGFFVASLALDAIATSSQNDALAAESEAAARQAEAEIEELDRQREFVDEEAATQKSARVRQADKDDATMQVGLVIMGGAGSVNEARLSQEVGYYEGLDIARLEGNRRRQAESLKASQESSKQTALNIGIQNKAQARGNTYSFLSSAVKTGASTFGKKPGAGAKVPAPKPSASFNSLNWQL